MVDADDRPTARELDRGLVGVGDRAVRVGRIDRSRNGGEQVLEALFARAQLRLRLLAVADVAGNL